ncbi:MAG: FAD-dependent oxidoreductase [Pseudomonadota bacterium]|nr:FAD-dependent oxidoreductase [Pseudomonadota bacterium]
MIVDYNSKGSILNPVKTLSFFTRKPITEPIGHRDASPTYRGFHVNDWEKCIGCSTCQKVCDNAAITMVRIPDLPHDEVKGVRNERPAIDYGRCCWCGLCVDICPTASLSLTREYIHTCTEAELDSYFILPDPNGIHKKHFEKGWAKSTDSDLVDLERQPMAEMEPDERLRSFDEMVHGFDDQQAIIEASRCVQCGMCHDSCPTHMNAPEYIRAIWEGNFEDAVEQIYRTNPFSHVCGRVCTRRCETACSVGRRGDPVSIRWLKRYALDRLDHETIKRIAHRGRASTPTGKSVAIIGAGPAGLTAAYDLARQGHAVTVFEALPAPGGMTRYGIPAYRLPYERIDEDVDVITSLGVEVRYNTRIGTDIPMADLEHDFDAVIVAIGLHLSRSTRVPGSDHEQVQGAIDLLRLIRLEEGKAFPEPYEVPRSVVIIGGGNTAMDIARSTARLQLKIHGESDVTLTALEALEDFLADPVEIRESTEEGVTIHDARGPREIVIEDGRIKGLKTLKVESIFDENGRFAPKYNEDDELFHEAEMVVEAIGQMGDISVLGDELTERLAWRRGRLQTDDGGQTSEPWLWAAGDIVTGPDVVHAVADGHRVANSINAMLNVEL